LARLFDNIMIFFQRCAFCDNHARAGPTFDMLTFANDKAVLAFVNLGARGAMLRKENERPSLHFLI
jgi:hypothetical protein